MKWRQLLANLEILTRVDGLIDEEAQLTEMASYLSELGLLSSLDIILMADDSRTQSTSDN